MFTINNKKKNSVKDSSSHRSTFLYIIFPIWVTFMSKELDCHGEMIRIIFDNMLINITLISHREVLNSY